MGLLQRLFGGSPQSNLPSSATARIGLGTSYSQQWDYQKLVRAVYGNPYGRMAVDYIAANMSRPDWEVRPPGSEETLEASPLLDLLNNPSPNVSGTDMQRTIATDMQLAKSFWLKLDASQAAITLEKTLGAHRWHKQLEQRGPVAALQHLNPGRVSVLGDEDDRLIGFIYSDRSGQRRGFTPEEIIYLRYPDPLKPFDGAPPVVSAALGAQTDVAAAQFNFELLANDAALPGYLTVEGLTAQQFQEWKSMWQSGEYPGKTRFLGGNGKYTPVGQSNKDMLYDKLREMSQEDIAVSFGLAYVLLSPTESTFSNMEIAKANAWQNKIHPTCVLVADQLSAQLGLDYKLDIGFDFDEIQELQESTDALVARSLQLVGGGVRTPNEVRNDLGLDPISGGDAIHLPAGTQSTSDDGTPIFERVEAVAALVRSGFAPEAALTAMGLPTIQHLGVLPVTLQPEEVATGDAAPLALAPAKDLDAELGELQLILKASDAEETKATPRERWVAFSRRVERYEGQAQRKVHKFFKTQGEVIATRVRSRKGKSLEKALHESNYWDEDRWNRELGTVAGDFLTDTVDAFGTDFTNDFDVSADRVRDYLSGRSSDIAALVNGTTKEDVRSLIADAQNDGQSIDQIADAIASYFSDNAEMRAERVARTEVIGASNFGTIEGARQSGVATAKTFLASDDAEEECAGYDGQSYGLDDDSVDIPVHPNCRCTWLIETDNGDVISEEGEA